KNLWISLHPCRNKSLGIPAAIFWCEMSGLCESEIQDLNFAVGAHHDIFRLNISVNNSPAVGEAKSFRHLHGIPHCFLRGDLSNHSSQRLAFNELHHDIVKMALLVEVMH